MTEQPSDARVHTIERCACGGYLWADYADPRDMERHVRHHRATLKHREWASRQGFAGYDIGAVRPD